MKKPMQSAISLLVVMTLWCPGMLQACAYGWNEPTLTAFSENGTLFRAQALSAPALWMFHSLDRLMAAFVRRLDISGPDFGWRPAFPGEGALLRPHFFSTFEPFIGTSHEDPFIHDLRDKLEYAEAEFYTGDFKTVLQLWNEELYPALNQLAWLNHPDPLQELAFTELRERAGRLSSSLQFFWAASRIIDSPIGPTWNPVIEGERLATIYLVDLPVYLRPGALNYLKNKISERLLESSSYPLPQIQARRVFLTYSAFLYSSHHASPALLLPDNIPFSLDSDLVAARRDAETLRAAYDNLLGWSDETALWVELLKFTDCSPNIRFMNTTLVDSDKRYRVARVLQRLGVQVEHYPGILKKLAELHVEDSETMEGWLDYVYVSSLHMLSTVLMKHLGRQFPGIKTPRTQQALRHWMNWLSRESGSPPWIEAWHDGVLNLAILPQSTVSFRPGDAFALMAWGRQWTVWNDPHHGWLYVLKGSRQAPASLGEKLVIGAEVTIIYMDGKIVLSSGKHPLHLLMHAPEETRKIDTEVIWRDIHLLKKNSPEDPEAPLKIVDLPNKVSDVYFSGARLRVDRQGNFIDPSAINIETYLYVDLDKDISGDFHPRFLWPFWQGKNPVKLEVTVPEAIAPANLRRAFLIWKTMQERNKGGMLPIVPNTRLGRLYGWLRRHGLHWMAEALAIHVIAPVETTHYFKKLLVSQILEMRKLFVPDVLEAGVYAINAARPMNLRPEESRDAARAIVRSILNTMVFDHKKAYAGTSGVPHPSSNEEKNNFYQSRAAWDGIPSLTELLIRRFPLVPGKWELKAVARRLKKNHQDTMRNIFSGARAAEAA